jgi:hypothetical protein
MSTTEGCLLKIFGICVVVGTPFVGLAIFAMVRQRDGTTLFYTTGAGKKGESIYGVLKAYTVLMFPLCCRLSRRLSIPSSCQA